MVLGTKVPVTHCKECETYIINNYKRINRENKSKIRIKLIKLLGGRCSCCGLDKWWVLVVDKIQYTKSSRETPHALYNKLIKNPDLIEEYQCLCYGCDKSKNIGGKCQLNHNLDKPKKDNFW